MKNPFARAGFDTLIGTHCTMNNGQLIIGANDTFMLDGTFIGDDVVKGGEDILDKTTLIVNGKMRVKTIKMPNVTITGEVECDLLIVEGVLALKCGGSVTAKEVRYRSLVIENGSVVSAQMNHLDHISAGEQT